VAQSGNGTYLHHHDVMASKQELLCGNGGSNLDATSNLVFHAVKEMMSLMLSKAMSIRSVVDLWRMQVVKLW